MKENIQLRLVVTGVDPVVSEAMARLLRLHVSYLVESLNLRDLSRVTQAPPDLILAECKDERLLEELRRHFPAARILARIPSEHKTLWLTPLADEVIDRLAPFETILQSLGRQNRLRNNQEDCPGHER